MLGKTGATPMIAVKDIDRARRFYEETLGLEAKEAMGGEVLEVKSGDTLINVYKSEFAGTNKATSLTFDVDDIEGEVRELKARACSSSNMTCRASSSAAISTSEKG